MIFEFCVRKLIKKTQNTSNNETIVGLCNQSRHFPVYIKYPKRRKAYSGPDLQLWGPRGNKNVETPASNNKFRFYCNYL
jgi:hypothetical protein